MRKARILKRRIVTEGKWMCMSGMKAIIWLVLMRAHKDSMLDLLKE